ncbi:RIB43A-like with coiled-coils protein 2 [Gigantopelta aegis]|uniref:RIB43A-like with coiled-coils protein 2 n=1 Tax=Gigantopelta aegis TaxID=1735272 RepID=UPI001B88B0B7|nr:RIB43A-like with coiled-coils protein 2 [Gigantopelta aegis]
MYKLDVAVDAREAAAIERRQNMEKQRQSRIFNARQRTIGMDIEALDDQIKGRNKEKKLRSNISDEDPCLSISGMQVFSGEDLQYDSRKDLQKEQITEKKRLSMEQKKGDQLYNMKAVEMDQRAFKEKAALQQQVLLKNKTITLLKWSNHIHGDMLTENPAVAQSAFGPHRVIPDRWKGMSPSQVSDILHTQALQRL